MRIFLSELQITDSNSNADKNKDKTIQINLKLGKDPINLQTTRVKGFKRNTDRSSIHNTVKVNDSGWILNTIRVNLRLSKVK